MRHSAAVLCQDKQSLRTLQTSLDHLGMELKTCRSLRDAMESVMSGKSTTLIVDFDMAGAEEVVRMAALLPGSEKPALLGVSTHSWLGEGTAFQSGVSRILYKPFDEDLVRDAIKLGAKAAKKNRRQSERHQLKTLVYLELASGTVPAISIDIAEHGLAVHALDPVPVTSNIGFRCMLPGSHVQFSGHADVMWASDNGRAGLFFSKLTAGTRKHLNDWLRKRHHHGKDAVRQLLPPADGHVAFAPMEEELAEAR